MSSCHCAAGIIRRFTVPQAHSIPGDHGWHACVRGAVCSGLLAITLSAPASADTIIDLGALADVGVGSNSTGMDINTKGLVTGWSGRHIFLYEGGTMHDLGVPLGGGDPFTPAFAFGINDRRQIVGYTDLGSTTSGQSRAFLYDGGSARDLGTLGGRNAIAYDINNDGYVVGESDTVSGLPHAFLYNGSTMRDLGPGLADGINEPGQVTGQAFTDRGFRAFVYSGGTMRLLEGTSAGHDINNLGHIAGDAGDHAFMYDGTTIHDLGTLGGRDSHGFGINDRGQVVGESRNASGEPRAFLYDGGTMHDLCTLANCVAAGWDNLLSAASINNAGWITGTGLIKGLSHAFLVIPDLRINIDIRPGNPRNRFVPWPNGKIWVAVLSESGFELAFDPASQIDIPEVEFGPRGAKPVHFKVKDMNQDGLGDLLMQFEIAETGIAKGDTEAALRGKTLEGQKFVGIDFVQTVDKKPVVICDPKVNCKPEHTL